MKPASPCFSVPAAVLISAVFTVASLAQAPSTQQPSVEAAHHEHHPEPAPTNLKVLPKTMTGDQVHDLMHQWEAALGTECSTCHAADPTRKIPNGRPALNFADDSKPEKSTARLMYRMVEDINKNYVSMVPESKEPVSCGTCHRGHVKPPTFVPPSHEHGHDHDHDHDHQGEEKAPTPH